MKNLEHELRLRKKAGKTIKVVGVALEMTVLATSIMSCSTQKGYYNSTPPLPKKVIPIHFQEYTSKDSILLKERETLNKKGVLFVQGHIIDEKTKEPICTAFITAKLSGKKTAADIDGNFTIEVEQGDTITIKFIGMQDRIIKLSEMNLEKLNVITLTESGDVLLYGPPGLGKTTLAGIIANELGVSLRITSGPAIEKPGDLADLLTNLNQGDVLFIDEIHRLSRSVEEILYPSMEDFSIDIITGKGQMAASYHLPLPKFTLVGATTRAGQLTAPLRDRFGVILRLELYTPQELAEIVTRSAGILDIEIKPDGALEIASRSRGTPRIANRLLKRVRDFAQVMSDGIITCDTARLALERLEIDELGLDRNDRRLLEAILNFYNGGPVGVETLAAAIGEEAVTIEDVYEPYLLQIGFLSRTPRGRCITAAACRHLGYDFPKGAVNAMPTQPNLFDKNSQN